MKNINSKNGRKYIVAGALGVTMVTLGVVGAADAAQRDGSQRMFGNSGQRGAAHLQVAADVIGVSVDDLQVRLKNGEHMPEILEASGVSREDMRAAHRSKMQERLEQAVASGKLSQEQAGERKAKMAERQGKHEAVRVAVENNDYDAWSAAVVGTPRANKITVENFAKVVEAHNLRESGDYKSAKEVMKDLGMGKGGMYGSKGGHRGGHRMHR